MLNFCGKTVSRGALGLLGLVLVLLFYGCGKGDLPENGTAGCGELSALSLGKNLKMGNLCGEDVLEISLAMGRDTLVKRFVLRKRGEDGGNKVAGDADLPKELAGATVLRVPLERVVALSSAQIGFLLRLGLADRIVGVGEGKYVADSALYARVAAGEVVEAGNGPTLSLEKVLAVKPDLVMDFATGSAHDDYERIVSLGVPLMLTSEWQEESPLAKVEWIKLFGKLFGVESLADSIFEQSKKDYLNIANGGVAGVSPARGGSEQQRASEGEASPDNNSELRTPKSPDASLVTNNSEIRNPNSEIPCPRVIAGMSYGGIWYAPGGNSYTARLIRDAGGCYLWASDTSRELQFTLEEIMLVVDSADVWVNPGAFSTPEELLTSEPRIRHIRAFREKRVCQNDGRKGPGGGNDFYESAVAHPAEILQNLRNCIQNATNGADSSRKEFDWYHNIFIF